jgi:hypothetical protein
MAAASARLALPKIPMLVKSVVKNLPMFGKF